MNTKTLTYIPLTDLLENKRELYDFFAIHLGKMCLHEYEIAFVEPKKLLVMLHSLINKKGENNKPTLLLQYEQLSTELKQLDDFVLIGLSPDQIRFSQPEEYSKCPN